MRQNEIYIIDLQYNIKELLDSLVEVGCLNVEKECVDSERKVLTKLHLQRMNVQTPIKLTNLYLKACMSQHFLYLSGALKNAALTGLGDSKAQSAKQFLARVV
jgi:hypothetical protein